MASLEEIRAGLDTPTHKNVNGERVDLTSQEVEDILDFQAEQLFNEQNEGYKRTRQLEYPEIKEQLDKLYHDIDGGLLGEDAKTGSWYLAIKEVKDDNPKPSE